MYGLTAAAKFAFPGKSLQHQFPFPLSRRGKMTRLWGLQKHFGKDKEGCLDFTDPLLPTTIATKDFVDDIQDIKVRTC